LEPARQKCLLNLSKQTPSKNWTRKSSTLYPNKKWNIQWIYTNDLKYLQITQRGNEVKIKGEKIGNQGKRQKYWEIKKLKKLIKIWKTLTQKLKKNGTK
jgi:hypothetical protein